MIVVNEHFSSWASFTTALGTADPQTYGLIAIGLVAGIILFVDRASKRRRRPPYPKHRRRYFTDSHRFGNRPFQQDAYRHPAELDDSRPLPASEAKTNADILRFVPEAGTARPVDGPPANSKPITLNEQLEAVRAVGFETIPLLNREEAKLLPLLESLVRSHGDGHRVMAQTSLGELIRPKNDLATTGLRSAAHASINSKRLDFAIINRWGHLVLAIEYQGSGHYKRDTAFLYDAVKGEAIRKANVEFFAVPANYTPEDVARRVRSVLVPQRPDPSDTPRNPAGGPGKLN